MTPARGPILGCRRGRLPAGKKIHLCILINEAFPVFRDISREYFDVEANHAFLSDAAVFGTLIGAALVPIVSSAFAVLQLCGALPN